MPELPEVETMVRGVRPVLEGAKVLQFAACPCLRKPMSIVPEVDEVTKRLEGRKILSVRRRAKRVLICFDSQETLVFEPRMTGLVLVSDPPSKEHLRYEFVVTRGRKRSSVWIWDRRGLGTIRLYNDEVLEKVLGPQVLGPDALEITLKEFRNRLRATQREVKVALLDQKLVAGVGNLYASEILHEAKVHPQTVSVSLTAPQVRKIHAAMGRILNEAILYEGSTLNDGTYRNALNKDGSYQNKHRVYAKQGETCPTCQRSEVIRIVQAQRSTFYCERCQRQ